MLKDRAKRRGMDPGELDELEFERLKRELEIEQERRRVAAEKAREKTEQIPNNPDSDSDSGPGPGSADSPKPASSTGYFPPPVEGAESAPPQAQVGSLDSTEKGQDPDAPPDPKSPELSSRIPNSLRGLKRFTPLDSNGNPIPQHYRDIVIDPNGQPRQAGADQQYGKWVVKLRNAAEKSLFLFAKGVLNRHFLTESLHKPVCEFIQTVPPFRKLILMPREHAKTATVSGALPLHIIIQPAETNIYFPGLEGSECRIMLAGENMRMAKKNLRVLESIHNENKLFRALWPQRCWEQPSRQAKVWNQEALIFPRENEWPDPTIWALGVDGAVTGSRPNVMVKDDLVSIEAANSDVIMDSAIQWHIASRALLDSYEVESGLQGLEFIIGTRWAVFDLYSYIQDNDPSVEVIDEKFHKIIRDGKILWPEKYTQESIEQLRKEHGSNFYLLYLNSAADPELVDFDLEFVREFKLIGQGEKRAISFDEDERDEYLAKKVEKRTEIPQAPKVKRGERLDAAFLRRMSQRGERFRARFG
jgi:hypothetical protein